jgi:hypothetical protein
VPPELELELLLGDELVELLLPGLVAPLLLLGGFVPLLPLFACRMLPVLEELVLELEELL